MKTAPLLTRCSLLLALSAASVACDTPSNLSTGVEQPPKSTYDRSPSTLPTNPSVAEPSTPRIDDPSDAPAEDPASGGTSHTPHTLDLTDGGLTSDAAAAAASAKPKRNATKPKPP
ncbi:MAG: hypothetical protein JWN48_588 [Myxococcaceae bacterium]|nr:hypothetical protein [Myxococcaceae bacterium]